MARFAKQGIPKSDIEKHIKIQSVLSAGTGPQGNQKLYTNVINWLEKKGPVTGGKISDGNVGVSAKAAEAINEIWEGRDNYRTLDV